MANGPDAISRAIVAQWPELAGKVHYVNGRAWCDGVNHTMMCEPLTPSADVPACRDEDPAWSASLAACYPEPEDDASA